MLLQIIPENSNLGVTAITAIVIVIIAIGTLIVSILKDDTLKESIVKRIIRSIRGSQYINIDDLKNHEFKIKLKTIISTGEHDCNRIITNSQKYILFGRYLTMYCQVFLDSFERIVNANFVNYNEQELKVLIIEEIQKRKEEYRKRTEAILSAINNDRNKVASIIEKLERWRATEAQLLDSNIVSTISNGRFTSVEYKLDVIFNQYMLGIDFMIKNSAESFEKLNGELTDFLNVN